MVVFLYWIWSNCLGQFFHRSEPVTILILLIVQAAEELLQGAAALTDRDAQRHLPLGTALRARDVLSAHVRCFPKPPPTCSKSFWFSWSLYTVTPPGVGQAGRWPKHLSVRGAHGSVSDAALQSRTEGCSLPSGECPPAPLTDQTLTVEPELGGSEGRGNAWLYNNVKRALKSSPCSPWTCERSPKQTHLCSTANHPCRPG